MDVIASKWSAVVSKE